MWYKKRPEKKEMGKAKENQIAQFISNILG